MATCKKCGTVYTGKCKPCRDLNRELNKEKIKAQTKARYLATKDRQLLEQKIRRSKNPLLFKERVKKWVDANPERMSALRKKWKENNKERVCAYSQSRRAKLFSTGEDFSENELKELKALQKNKCAVCRASIDEKFHADHIMPIAKGGSNSIKNIQLLCPKCNLQKGAKHPVDFMQSRGFLL